MKHWDIQAVLWDMDGTLADTGPYHFKAWAQVFAEHNIHFSKETQRASFGKNSTGIIEHHFGYLPEPDVLKTISQRKETIFRDLAQGQASLYPGARTWLDSIRNAGIIQAIASSAPPKNIEIILEDHNLAPYFSAVVSGDSLPAKPDPTVFLTASQQLAIPPTQCLVIEDHITGVQAAKNAGMRCIAITNTHPCEELHEADFVLDQFVDLDVPFINI